MKLGKLRELIDELPSHYDDCDIIIDADHHGSEVASSFECDMFYIDQGWYEKPIYTYEEVMKISEFENINDFTRCVVIG